MKFAENRDTDAIMKWFSEEIGNGENSILVYPDLPTFRRVYSDYVNKEFENLAVKSDTLPRIILIAAFYETLESVKNHLANVGVDIQRHIDDGSLVVIDAFNSYYPDMAGMKKLVATLSRRATKEGRPGVTAIINMGFFFLFGGDGEATKLINYEASLPVKIATGEGSNVKGFTCYNAGDYATLSDDQKRQLAQRHKKVLKVTNE